MTKSIRGIARSALYIALPAAAALALATAPAAAQDAKVVAGTLTCEGQGTVGMVIGSKEELVCKYEPVGGGPVHRFAGSTTRVGLDVGIRGKSVMIWTVLGSTTQVPGERLKGNFAGVSADVAAGLGVGANVLLGGNNKSIVLQPVSVKGEVGLNVALGIAALSLTPLP